MVSSQTRRAVGSVLLAMLTGSLVPSSTEAWTTAQPHLMRIVSAGSSSSPSSSPASPLTGVPSLSTRAVTRWDEHLNLAKREHHRKNWGQVRQLCTGVISIADDWTAVEQAHLRLALAEQKDQRVDAARRAFQVRVVRLLAWLVVAQWLCCLLLWRACSLLQVRLQKKINVLVDTSTSTYVSASYSSRNYVPIYPKM